MALDLATALAAERAIVRRAVAETRATHGGWVIEHPPLADIWHLNRVHLTGESRSRGPLTEATVPLDLPRAPDPARDVDAFEALVARELAGRATPHRRVTLDDESAAEALWPALEERGWRRERAVVMVRRGSARDGSGPAAPAGALAPAERGEPAGPADETRVISESALMTFQALAFAENSLVTALGDDLPARLAAAQSVLRAGTAWRAFGAGDAGGGLPASTTTLYLDPDVGGQRVAFIDQVATLRAQRERGLARAVVDAALRAAAAWRADLLALFADADDWPQVFYASLGFQTLGRQTAFHRDF